MPEYLAHLHQRGSTPKHLGGQGVAEPVGPDPPHTRPVAGPPGDTVHQIGPDGPRWRLGSEEHLADRRRRTGLAQVDAQGFADIGGQRQTIPAASLAPHDDLSGSPVDVPQLKAGHFR